MKSIFYIICLALTLFSSCTKVKEGFLNTTYAIYMPNSMVLEEAPDRVADWVSPPLQGYDGTQPIFITIHQVKAENGGNVELFLKETVLRGNGTFAIPVDNKIPNGSYMISLMLKNKDYSSVLSDVFTIVVEDK